MFETLSEIDPESKDREEKPTSYAGLWIGLACLPVLAVFIHFHEEQMGMAASVYLGMAILAVGIRWELKKYVWFWIAIILILALHLAILLYVPFPKALNRMGLLPIGIADLLIDLGCIKVIEKLTQATTKVSED